ncbi:MAG TPA: methyltransferase domain-containing protein [Chitinophagaceae bacterium]|nr:methyltransferase domain-containing protein [Chitinophagaceae bacterium]
MQAQYTIDEHNFERQYLLAKMLAPLSLQALQKVPLTQGAAILDVACGIGETSRLLHKHFENVSVTGADLDNSLVQAARAQTPPGLAVNFVAADASYLPFNDNSFDMVFSRYLLMHVPEAAVILREMKRVCKPGGIVFAQEPDISSSTCYPHSWAYDKIVEYFNALFVDGLVGRKLPALFSNAELRNINHSTGVAFEVADNSLRRMYTLTGEALEDALLSKRIATRQEYTAWVNELKRVEHDTGTVHLTHPVVAVWGVK